MEGDEEEVVTAGWGEGPHDKVDIRECNVTKETLTLLHALTFPLAQYCLYNDFSIYLNEHSLIYFPRTTKCRPSKKGTIFQDVWDNLPVKDTVLNFF